MRLFANIKTNYLGIHTKGFERGVFISSQKLSIIVSLAVSVFVFFLLTSGIFGLGIDDSDLITEILVLFYAVFGYWSMSKIYYSPKEYCEKGAKLACQKPKDSFSYTTLKAYFPGMYEINFIGNKNNIERLLKLYTEFLRDNPKAAGFRIKNHIEYEIEFLKKIKQIIDD